MNQRLALLNLTIAATFVLVLGYPSVAHAQSVSVLVAYHSGTGNTEKMAQGVAEGAKSVPGSSVSVQRVGEVSADDLLSADALVIGSQGLCRSARCPLVAPDSAQPSAISQECVSG
jgi:NAD(P)H dehydrogenase (quinone)